ncbi:DUF2798 domain-containing protein [Pelagibacterium mangrovi]|uniref:DUF2798 domain-containing protein n=1 Tax=Pelagibacterium mangrovi TaxID=3119828 RepID=UPI002FC5D0B6
MTDKKTLLLAQLFITFQMAISMSGIMSLFQLGLTMEWLMAWPGQFIIAWPSPLFSRWSRAAWALPWPTRSPAQDARKNRASGLGALHIDFRGPGTKYPVFYEDDLSHNGYRSGRPENPTPRFSRRGCKVLN